MVDTSEPGEFIVAGQALGGGQDHVELATCVAAVEIRFFTYILYLYLK